MILGIIGGMGPLATCDFFQKIINITHADKDQEHLHIMIDNNTNIPDRTDYILGKGEDPRIELIRSAIRLENMGADYIAIPCNTAHYFYDDIIKYTKVKVLNMIEETALYLKDTCSQNEDYLLLATKGTYETNVYNNIFQKFGLNIIEPKDKDKDAIMDWIYEVKSSKFDVTPRDFEILTNKYIKDKDIPAILGCTELSTLADKIDLTIKYIDSMDVLAKRCVKLCAPTSTDS